MHVRAACGVRVHVRACLCVLVRACVSVYSCTYGCLHQHRRNAHLELRAGKASSRQLCSNLLYHESLRPSRAALSTLPTTLPHALFRALYRYTIWRNRLARPLVLCRYITDSCN